MIYVKFDEDNKSSEMRTDPPLLEEESKYVEVSDDSLFGKRLVKVKNKVREFTEKEYVEEARQIDLKHKAVVIDNMARVKLKHSIEEITPDVYEDLTASQKEKVKKYRDALRNISKQEKYPEFVEFPDEISIGDL